MARYFARASAEAYTALLVPVSTMGPRTAPATVSAAGEPGLHAREFGTAMSVNPPYKLPAFAKIAIFLGVLALAGIMLRVFDALGRQQPMSDVFTWADARYYVGIWAIFSLIYYVGWAIWRFTLRGKTTSAETLEIKSDKEE